MVDISRRTLVRMTGAAAVAGAVPLAASAAPAAARTPVEKGSFARPASGFRPRIRWWMPGALMDDAEIDREVAAIAQAGLGGAEVAVLAPRGVDQSAYGWGTPAWNRKLQTVLDAARRHGITVDLTIGPVWPAGVPSLTTDSAAASQELLYGKAVVEGGAVFDGAVPPLIEVDLSGPLHRPRTPGRASLAAVTAARIAPGSAASDRTVLLDPGSLTDLTAHVHDGRITWTAPRDGTWLLFSLWHRGTGQVVGLTDGTVHVVDHYSAEGTRAVTGYWEQHLLTPPVRRLLAQTGSDLFEDSLEISFALPWTPGMAAHFRASRGYDLAPFLPVLFIPGLHTFQGALTSVTPDSPADFDLPGGLGARVRNDYYQALTELYERHHLDGIRTWAHAQGLRYRAQVSYGAVLDMSSAAAHVDQPETEQLFFADEIDAYRAMAGGAHLAGSPALSSEIGARTEVILQDAYGVTWQRMLEIIHQNYAGGVAQAVVHGFAYADAPGAAWPGWAPFAAPKPDVPGFAEAWGPRQPVWHHMPDITGYLARQQSVLRAGRAQVDVAVYRHAYWDTGGQKHWPDTGLQRAGFGYEFVGPGPLTLPSATVGGGRLAPQGPGYRALVLDGQKALDAPAAERILSCARAGLAVVVVGDPPEHAPYAHDADQADAAVRATVQRLLAHARVRHVATEADVPGALRQLGVRPSAEPSTGADLLHVHRRDGDRQLHWFFNPGSAQAETRVSLEGRGHPYVLDAWTGQVHPLTCHTRESGRTEVTVRLAPRQTALVALCRDTPPGPVTGTTLDAAGTPAVPGGARRQELASWRLTVDDWRPGATATQTEHVRHELHLDALKPWPEIAELQDVSGIGTYSTEFTVADVPSTALLDLGNIHGTFRVTLNGEQLPPVDQTRPVVALDGRLRAGRNTLAVEVATTLRNRLRVTSPSQSGTVRQPYGMHGPVTLMLW
ncbi:glycosyl hydrolase [Streptomyces sp. NPDC002536]